MTGAQTDVPQVLAAEEQGAGLQQPTGIGQRPRPMSSEEGPQASVKNSKNSPQLPTNDKYGVVSKTVTVQYNVLDIHTFFVI